MKGGNLGWILSALLHIGVAVVALLGLPELSRSLPEPPPTIAIEFVKIDEQTRQKQPEAKEEQVETEQEPQKNYAAAENTPPPVADAVPTLEKAKPEPKPVKALPKPEPKPEVSEARKLATNIVPRSKPKAPSRLKSSRIADLIDRSIKEEKQIAPKAEEKQEEKQKMFNELYSDKILDLVSEKCKLESKEVTYDEFVKLAAKK